MHLSILSQGWAYGYKELTEHLCLTPIAYTDGPIVNCAFMKICQGEVDEFEVDYRGIIRPMRQENVVRTDILVDSVKD